MTLTALNVGVYISFIIAACAMIYSVYTCVKRVELLEDENEELYKLYADCWTAQKNIGNKLLDAVDVKQTANTEKRRHDEQ